ncbi:MAG: hypothetical protein KIT73_13030, partial [Burkholderiales bacterium]|nr:hypothetical protein [Burkholderiales bacterium]
MSMPVDACDGDESEVAALVQQLHHIQERLRALTGGDAESVGGPVDQPHLPRQADEQPRPKDSEPDRSIATLTAVLDALAPHVALLDESGSILSVNESWKRFFDVNDIPMPGF